MQDRRPRIDVDHTFQTAVRLDYARKLDEAEKLYQTILAEAPDHHDSLFRLGFFASKQLGSTTQLICSVGQSSRSPIQLML